MSRERRGTGAPRFEEHPGHAGFRIRMGQDSRSVARFRKRSAIMSGRLNADASVPAVTCANQVLRRFPDPV